MKPAVHWHTVIQMADRTLTATTLPAAVADRLRDLITEGQLPPGTRLNERLLCTQLGVSRTPLREAFRLLASDGLVEMHPNRGARVVSLSEQDIRECFELMGGLEALGGELACARITAEAITEIKALTYRMLACHARRDLPAYYQHNRLIHDRINAAAGNALLTQAFTTLNRRIQNLRFRSNFDDEKWNRAAAEHEAMVDALERRDGPQLAAIMRNHLAQKGIAVLDGLRAAQREAAASAAVDNVKTISP
jgi:DNA-binding GntR family transcriptional regulator